MNENYFNELEQILSKNDDYLVEGRLNRNKIAELAHKYNGELIDLLAAHKDMRRLFFAETRSGVLIFNKDKLIQFISNKEFLPDSFTAYKNKIGLGTGTSLLSQDKEVVLNWPYKDCILEGGQDKEDAKRDEVFYNAVLAPDQIDRLLDEKVLTGWKRYDNDGEHDAESFVDTDNLILRGNNLLALHSLKKRYAGRIKLIYIDPPFNTGDDEFRYNDRFKHSTWLTFMRNRLDVARTLLSADGVIAVCIGHEEADYVKVLLDEVFQRVNYLNHITNTTNDPSGFKATSSKIFSTANHTYLYAKDASRAILNKLYMPKGYDSNYKYVLVNPHEPHEQWVYELIVDRLAQEQGFNDVKDYKKLKSKAEREGEIAEYADRNKDVVFRTAAISGGALAKRQATVAISKAEKGKVFQHPNEDVDGFYILNGEMMVFWGSLYREIEGQIVPTQALTDVWSDIKWTGIASEGGVTLKNGKKPERLLKRIIELTTNTGDIVLDYHLGSGTTAAVAHKMNRQYIGIEQLEYGDNDAVTRLRNVIMGDNTGVSKTVGWQGGGGFVYARLMDLGNKFIEKVKAATTDAELVELLEQAKKSSFLSYRVDSEKINPGHKDFVDLSMAHKKQLLLEVVDHNHLYVNYSEIDDKDYDVPEVDKALNRQFYNN